MEDRKIISRISYTIMYWNLYTPILISKIPEDFENRKNLVYELKNFETSLVFTSPELIQNRINQLSSILIRYFSNFQEEEWILEVNNIWIQFIKGIEDINKRQNFMKMTKELESYMMDI